MVKSTNGLDIVKVVKSLGIATSEDGNFSNKPSNFAWGFQVVDIAALHKLEGLKHTI